MTELYYTVRFFPNITTAIRRCGLSPNRVRRIMNIIDTDARIRTMKRFELRNHRSLYMCALTLEYALYSSASSVAKASADYGVKHTGRVVWTSLYPRRYEWPPNQHCLRFLNV